MIFLCRQSRLRGRALIPGSKSHTIRGLAIAALAEGESVLQQPLQAADTNSALNAVVAMGAEVEQKKQDWLIRGFGPEPRPRCRSIDVGNSGTSLNILMSMAGLLPAGRQLVFTGDHQIRARPAGPLLRALRELGAQAFAHRHNDCAPLTVGGRLRGGRTVLPSPTSQYLTSLLIACPLAGGDAEIEVPFLHEAAYVRMTLDWLRRQALQIEYTPNMEKFRIPGGQNYRPFRRRIPADFSSATFFLVAGALPGNQVLCEGLDVEDCQGDKAVLGYLQAMGAGVTLRQDGVQVQPGEDICGRTIDLNDTPDALPAMAVLACFAAGETRLVNVPQARIKETDRIAVMAAELTKMGADIQELEDGLLIRQSRLRGAAVAGHGDHRVVMALALAGLNCPGETRVDTAECAAVTFPGYLGLMRGLGGEIEAIDKS